MVLGKCPTCQASATRLPVGVEGALVGRRMIADDAHLRSFSIAKPLTKQAADEVGHEALSAWRVEDLTPPA